jgi:aminoglycoside phosphotransferase (APT) family kinase protein
MNNAINEVWRCGDYIVRVHPRGGATRLQREAALLRDLPAGTRAPVPIAAGPAPWGEWMVTQRIPGQELSRAWGRLRVAERHRAITELALALKVLHAVPAPLDGPAGDPDECPHALPIDVLAGLLANAAALPGVDRGVMAAAADRLASVADALDDQPTTLIHGDLHPENVLVGDDGRLTGVIDFEWARAGPPDLDLDILLHSLADPSLHVESGDGSRLQRRDFDEVAGWMRDAYPELFSHPRLSDRLWVYRLAYEVHALVTQGPGRAATGASFPPHHPYQRIVRLVGDRSDLGWFLTR